MTNEEMIADLKQFIEATVYQQTSHLPSKDDVKSMIQEVKDDLVSVERRLLTLERQPA